MKIFLMKPKIDFAFKEIMMNDNARLGFLSAVLKLKPEDIKKTVILNTDLRRIHKDEKQGILDVRILMNDNTVIDIEIQITKLKVWAERSLFYISKMYSEQIKPGENYGKLKKCISISILDFVLFPDNSSFYSSFHIREDKCNTLYTDKFEFHVIELPKLPEIKDGFEDGGDDILLWAEFFKSEREEDFNMLASRNKYIKSAYEQLQIISQDKKKQLEYEAREKAILDYNQLMYEARTEGEEAGSLQKAASIAGNLINLGVSIDIITASTGLSVEQVESIRQSFVK